MNRRRPRYYGLMAEFDTPTAIVAAARRAYAEGYRRMDTYTPFPVEGLAEELHFHRTRVPLIVLLGGLTGCLGGYFLQYWIMAIYWPVNVGGRSYVTDVADRVAKNRIVLGLPRTRLACGR